MSGRTEDAVTAEINAIERRALNELNYFVSNMSSIPNELLPSYLSKETIQKLFVFNLGVETTPQRNLLVSVWPAFTNKGMEFQTNPLGMQMKRLLEKLVSVFVKNTTRMNKDMRDKIDVSDTIVNNFANLLGEPCMAEVSLTLNGHRRIIYGSDGYANFMVNAFARELGSKYSFAQMTKLPCKVGERASRYTVYFLNNSA